MNRASNSKARHKQMKLASEYSDLNPTNVWFVYLLAEDDAHLVLI